jgi:AT-hook transcription factor
MTMPVFREAGPDAKQRLVRASKGYQQRQVYRDYLSRLGPQQENFEVQPEGDETIRKLKVNVRRAANELKLDVGYGETTDGTLLVWLDNPRERTRGRGRPRKSPELAASPA